jgi:phage shock protein E
MRRLSVLFVGLLVAAGCSGQNPVASSIGEPRLSSASAAHPEREVCIIDVRSQQEWNSGHLETAIHIPHAKIADRIGEVTDNKNARIVVYCAAGGRAGMAKETLEQLGFTNVENGGGYEDVKRRYE